MRGVGVGGDEGEPGGGEDDDQDGEGLGEDAEYV